MKTVLLIKPLKNTIYIDDIPDTTLIFVADEHRNIIGVLLSNEDDPNSWGMNDGKSITCIRITRTATILAILKTHPKYTFIINLHLSLS